MPVAELIRYFNAADTAGDSTLYVADQRVEAWHAGLRLGSLFQPIVDLRSERIVGHQASLAARHENGTPASGQAAYAHCESPAAVVHFDRLCRTLHALNFLTQRRHAGGYLQLPVHTRHLQAVPNQHGLVYEAILKRCGLAPQDIVLQVDASALASEPDQLQRALANYRQRGYRLAVLGDSPGRDLRPDIIQYPSPPAAGEIPPGVLSEIIEIDNGAAYLAARQAGAALGQGQLFGTAQADCRPTHDPRRVAYNSPILFGESHENRQ